MNTFNGLELHEHPRLYLGRREQGRLRRKLTAPLLKRVAAGVRREADEYLAGTQFEWVINTHNAHLLRARTMQRRVVTLLVEWQRSGSDDYRQAAMEHLRELGRWDIWSWIAWRDGNYAPDAIFDLSYGENSATLAIGYDWLRETLSEAERAELLQYARRPVDAFMKHSAPETRMWWYGKRDSNWNTVCAGGGGMLALAFYEELPEAAVMLERAVDSIGPFVEEIRKCHGAWPEGIGYWNYGMRYLYMFALSLEAATGEKQAWIDERVIRESLMFPLLLTPYPATPCSFGDVNHFKPLPFHFAAARRMGDKAALAALERAANETADHGRGTWPDQAELLCLYDAGKESGVKTRRPFVHHYQGQDWVILADQMPRPQIYASIRGGTTEVPHGHIDLTSFHAVIGGEKMITSLGPHSYLDTTFSERRWDLFEMIPMSKNVFLVDGAGMARPATIATSVIKRGGEVVVKLEAAEALGRGRRGGDGIRRYHRYFVLLPETGLLVVDEIERPNASLFEQRFFTQQEMEIKEGGFVLRGERVVATLSCACNEEMELHSAAAPMTRPQPGARQPLMMRHMTKLLHTQVVMAALLAPGKKMVPLAVAFGARGAVEVRIGGKRGRVVRLHAGAAAPARKQ